MTDRSAEPPDRSAGSSDPSADSEQSADSPERSVDSPETVCPRCAVGCRLERGDVDGGRVRATGRVGPSNPDGRLCRGGIHAFEAVDGDDRLTRPEIRRDGERRPVSWEAAFQAVVERFEAIRDAHGPDALAFLGAPHSTTEENYLLQKLARCLGTNNVDNRARHCHAATARALSERLGWPATTNGLDDLRESEVILVAGANPAERQPVAFNAFVRPAVEDGATLVHVDPVGNRTTRLADVHLTPRPGRDALVFDLLSARVLAAGGVDREFVARRTRGYDAFEAALSAFDCERARSVAGVDADAVDRVAARVADADRVAAVTGTGIEGDAAGASAPDALLNLLLSTGSFGRRGTGLFVFRGLVNEQGATDAGCVPDRLPGHRPVTDAAARARVESEWGVAPPSTPGRTASELLAEFGDGIRGALVVGEDPAVSKREADWVRRRLDALDALVVVDAAESGTTPAADVLLPAAAGVEKAGTVTSLDRRVQRLRPAASPPGAARSDFDVLRGLGRRLVGGGRFDYAGPGEAFDELTRVAPTHAGVAYADLGDEGRRWPFDRDGVLYRESFATADGRAPFAPVGPIDDAGVEEGLRLVADGRSGDAHGARDPAALRIHPDDAAERGVGAGEAVVVSRGEAAVEAVARLDDRIRRGTVSLHAAAADPLVRCGASTVAVEPRR